MCVANLERVPALEIGVTFYENTADLLLRGYAERAQCLYAKVDRGAADDQPAKYGAS